MQTLLILLQIQIFVYMYIKKNPKDTMVCPCVAQVTASEVMQKSFQPLIFNLKWHSFAYLRFFPDSSSFWGVLLKSVDFLNQ